MGVKRLVHMSHVNASPNPETAFLKNGSEFLKTKYEGELAVRNEFPDATIFRCSDIYGQGDYFINNLLSRRSRVHTNHAVPLYLKGKYTVKAPVHMSDVATGIMNSLYDPEAVGETYEAVGPQRFTMDEIVRYIFEMSGRNNEQWNFHISELMLDPRAFLKVFLVEKSPFGNNRYFHQTCLDSLERLSISDNIQGLPNLEDLGVKLNTMEKRIPWEVAALDAFGYHQYESLEDGPQSVPPREISFGEQRALQIQRQNGILNIIPGLA